ncbi:MAG TPA: hypothetical protein VID67_10735 [Rhizomicrobium sp.]|jgi:hypothetical protein
MRIFYRYVKFPGSYQTRTNFGADMSFRDVSKKAQGIEKNKTGARVIMRRGDASGCFRGETH